MSTRIKAYTYNADIYCADCMGQIAAEWIKGDQIQLPMRGGWKALAPAPPPGWSELSTEGLLHAIAGQIRTTHPSFDRYDERSFDSGDFPKVVFGNQVCDEGHDHCGACHTDLCEE